MISGGDKDIDTSPQSAQGANSPGRGRVRTGCLTCRAKKVKCDEQRPNCFKCTRLNRICVYKNRAPGDLQTPPPSQDVDSQLLGSEVSCGTQGYHPDHASHCSRMSCTFHQLCSTPTQLASGPNTHSTNTSPSAQPSPLNAVPQSGPLHRWQLDSPRSETTILQSPSALALMTSQDIYLCTTIDLLAATEVRTNPSFLFFVHEVRPPILPFIDQVNFGRMKICVANMGTQEPAIASAILAVQYLYRAQANGLSTSRAMTLYQAATSIFNTMLCEHDQDQNFDSVLIVAFLLCLFEIIVLEETGSIFHRTREVFATRLQVWIQETCHSPLSLRIVAWLQIIHAAARRGGNPGVLPSAIIDALTGLTDEIPSLASLDTDTDAPTTVYDLVTNPIFDFYLELEKKSTQVANLSHYHRSRTTSADQEEAWDLMAHIKIQIYQLWEARPALMRLQPDDLRKQFSNTAAEPLIALIGICTAAYHTEIVEVGRTISDPPLASHEAKQAMRRIRGIIEGDWNAYASGKLNTGYLRPLFLYAIESIAPDDTKWALERLREIKDPVSRSDFFASFAHLLTEAQRRKGRRVTTKYFCYQTFGVSPPLL